MFMHIALENALLGETDLLCTGTHRVPPGRYCVSHCLGVIFFILFNFHFHFLHAKILIMIM